MDIVQQGRDLQKKLDQLEQNVMERKNVTMAQEQEQKVRLESLKNQTSEQQEILQNNKRELNLLCEQEKNKKLSIEQLDQQILIKTKNIAELGRQEMVKKQQLEEVMQKAESQKRMLEVLETQAQKATETWKSNFDNLEQKWNCRVADINAEEERRLKKVEDKERTMGIEIAQKETEKRETNRKEFELELELVKKSIAEGYAKLKKIHKQTKLVQNYGYLQQMVSMPSYQQSPPPINPNLPSPLFNSILSNNPVNVEQSVLPPQPIIPNQPIQSGLFLQPPPSAQPSQDSQLVGQFYNQQKLLRQQMLVQDELVRRAAAAVNANLPSQLPPQPATTAEFDFSFNTPTKTVSQTLSDVIPEMVQSFSSPSEFTTSCPVPVNPINIDIDQCPNSNNAISVICYASSTSALAPTATTESSTLLSPEASTTTKSSTTTSELISSATTSTLPNSSSAPLSPTTSTLAFHSLSANLDQSSSTVAKSLNLDNGIDIITIDDSDDDDEVENCGTIEDNETSNKSKDESEQRERQKWELYLAQKREYMKQRRANETPKERERRLKYLIERRKWRVVNETPEQRELRLAKQRQNYYIRRSMTSNSMDIQDGMSNSSFDVSDSDYEDQSSNQQSGMVEFNSTKRDNSTSGNKVARTSLKRKAKDNVNYGV